MTLLAEILRVTEARVRELAPRRAELEHAAAAVPPAPAWTEAFGGEEVVVIGEIKRRSPSAGWIAPKLDAPRVAQEYVAGGVAAISVLTDGPHFGGSLEDLRAVRAAVAVPLLRKDFIVDPLQLLEARAAGASAVLLIARALEEWRLVELATAAHELGLARMVEVHDLRELERAIRLAPEAIGVNSRDLATFAVSLPGMAPLLQAVPPDVVAVAESGIARREEVEQVADWGADAILVGTALARTADRSAAVRGLTGVRRRSRSAEPARGSDG